MRRHALRARPRRRRLPADAGECSLRVVSPNVLNRQFRAPAPNRNWVADFTYIWTAEGWLSVQRQLELMGNDNLICGVPAPPHRRSCTLFALPREGEWSPTGK